eukprot:10229482-Karenia_brevis.AAC.1
MAYPEDVKIQGRCLGVRERSSKHDFFHLVLYWPNVSTPNLLKVLHAMVKWTKKVLQSLPLRCVPIIYMDANSSFGCQHHEGGIVQVQSACIGPHNNGVENVVGRAIIDILQQFGMGLCHTMRESPWTFYNNFNTGSHIDHIAVPLSMIHNADFGVKPV